MKDYKLSNEDRALFESEMKSVTPLQKRPQQSLFPNPPPPRRRPRTDCIDPPPFLYLSSQYHLPVEPNAILSYHTASLPIKRFKQLKNGLIPREARLDLHGLNVDSAADALRRFIVHQLQSNARCLHIIHGKGGQQGEAPVIKSFVNHWLRQIPEVMAFHSALPCDGGNGALYLLLKKNR